MALRQRVYLVLLKCSCHILLVHCTGTVPPAFHLGQFSKYVVSPNSPHCLWGRTCNQPLLVGTMHITGLGQASLSLPCQSFTHASLLGSVILTLCLLQRTKCILARKEGRAEFAFKRGPGQFVRACCKLLA